MSTGYEAIGHKIYPKVSGKWVGFQISSIAIAVTTMGQNWVWLGTLEYLIDVGYGIIVMGGFFLEN